MMRTSFARKLAAPAVVASLAVGTLWAGATVGTAAPERARAQIAKADGTVVGVADFKGADGRVVVKIAVRGLGPGFHGFHVHASGVCDAAATDAAGNPSPFFTAGGHYNPAASTHGAHAGDMPALLVNSDGSGFAKFETDRFTIDDLLVGDGSAVIIHAGPDNLAHVPAFTAQGAERYHSHVDSVMGPDAATRATGDAGARTACGVIASE